MDCISIRQGIFVQFEVICTEYFINGLFLFAVAFQIRSQQAAFAEKIFRFPVKKLNGPYGVLHSLRRH